MRTKVLIVYKSKYGSIEQYAKWIQNEIGCDLWDVKGKTQLDFQNYDIIVFGSYLRLGKIKIAPFVINNWNKIKGKKIMLFTASGFPVEHPQIRKIYEGCFPKNIREEIKFFPLRGKLKFQKLTVFDKLLIFVASKFEKDEEIKQGMQNFDGVKQENLTPLLDYLKQNGI